MLMLLLIHITVALLGLVQATYTFAVPTQRKIRGTYALLAATIGSGTYLVWREHAPVLSSCLSGLLYVGVMLVAVWGAHYRLPKQLMRATK